MKLKGKVSIVTGGGQGIGYVICLRFAREGSYIVIPDIDADKARKTCQAIKDGGRSGIYYRNHFTGGRRVVRQIILNAVYARGIYDGRSGEFE